MKITKAHCCRNNTHICTPLWKRLALLAELSPQLLLLAEATSCLHECVAVICFLPLQLLLLLVVVVLNMVVLLLLLLHVVMVVMMMMI
jgi:hypothetical protein